MKRLWLTVALISLMAANGVVCPAGTHTLSVTATVLSKSICKFHQGAANVLPIGTLDPGNPVDASASLQMTVHCAGSSPQASFFISNDNGLYGTGPNVLRMRHATVASEYMPYILTITPQSATVPKNVDTTVTITGKVRGADYRDARVGGFSDTVVISLMP